MDSGLAPKRARPGMTLRLHGVNERPWARLGAGGHLDVDQIRPAMRKRLFQRGAESGRSGDARGGDAEGFGELHKIRVDQVGGYHAAVEALDLVAPYVAVSIVVEHQRHHTDVELHRGGKLLHAEHEAAVA